MVLLVVVVLVLVVMMRMMKQSEFLRHDTMECMMLSYMSQLFQSLVIGELAVMIWRLGSCVVSAVLHQLHGTTGVELGVSIVESMGCCACVFVSTCGIGQGICAELVCSGLA